MKCVLCDIAAKAKAATVHYEDNDLLAITPLREMAPTHVLLFPRVHYVDLPSYLETQPESASRLMQRASMIATERGLSECGFRLVWNFGPDTKQQIMHPHLHLLGGRQMLEQLA